MQPILQKPEFLLRIQDVILLAEERLILLVQFIALNGIDGPMEMLPAASLPRGFVFRLKLLADLVLCVAVPMAEAEANPTGAVGDSAQLWQLALQPNGDIVARDCGVVCTVNGALTKILHIDDRRRGDALLKEWSEAPPSAEDLGFKILAT